jgi:hypothetical protein
MDQLYDTEPGQPRVPLRATPEGYLIVQIAGGGGGGGSSVTNLTTTVSPTNVVVASDTGTDATIPLADVTNAGAMSPAAVQQLAGLGTASEADVGDFAAAGHTHTLLMTTDERTKLGALPAAADLTTSLAGKMANTLPAMQTAFSAGTAPEKAAFQASVSGGVRVRMQSSRITDVMAVPPTITWAATVGVTGGRVMLPFTDSVEIYGFVPTVNGASGRVEGVQSIAGIGLKLFGDKISFGWRCLIADADRFKIFVDGKSVSTGLLQPSISTVGGSYYYLTLDFGSVATRTIEFYGCPVSSLVSITIPKTASVSPARLAKPKVMFVGDSFVAGSNGVTTKMNLPACAATLHSDANVMQNAYGGSGYVTPGASNKPFGHANRIALASEFAPDHIVFLGSVNDTTAVGLGAAATATWEAYRAVCPAAKIHVIGPQPTSAAATLSTIRQEINAAVLGAARASSVVSTVLDSIGTELSTPAPFVAFQTYQPGELCTNYGSVWRHTSNVAKTYPAAGAPGYPGSTYPQWSLVTWDMYGTGDTATLTGDGSRDVLLYSDLIHPTDAMTVNWGLRMIGVCT